MMTVRNPASSRAMCGGLLAVNFQTILRCAMRARVLLLAFLVVASSSCTRHAAPAKTPPAAAPVASRDVALIAYRAAELRAPDRFDPSGRLLGEDGDKTCAIWERGGRYLGEAPSDVCSSWLSPGEVRESSPRGDYERASADGVLRVRHRSSGRVVFRSPADVECHENEFAWSAADSSFVVRCGDMLLAVDLQTGREIGRTRLDPGLGVLTMVWGEQVHAVFNESGTGPALLAWDPKTSKTSIDRGLPGVYALQFILDPVSGGVWRKYDMCGHSCHAELKVFGGVGDPTNFGYYENEQDGVHVAAIAAHPEGSAFAVDRTTEAHDGTVHDITVGTVGGRFQPWHVFYSCCDDTIQMAVSRGGDRLVLVVHSTRFVENAPATKVVVVSPDGSVALEVASDPILHAAFVDDYPEHLRLSDDERSVLVEGRKGAVVVPLDGRAPPRRPTVDDVGTWQPAQIADGRDFSFDGDVVTRRADGVSMSSTEPCWFPESWPDVRLASHNFRVGADPLRAREVNGAAVSAVFCPAGLFDRFLRGAPMPARPSARMTLL